MFIKRGLGKINSIIVSEADTVIEENVEESTIDSKVANKSTKNKTIIVEKKIQKNN